MLMCKYYNFILALNLILLFSLKNMQFSYSSSHSNTTILIISSMKPAKRKKISKDNENSGGKNENDDSKDYNTMCFKKSEYQSTKFTHQTKTWKNIKHVTAMEKSMFEPGVITHASISAAPSTKPVKNYSDLSGLPALYKDPKSKLKYYNKEEYQAIMHLSPDIILGLLSLRKAT